LSGKHRTFSGKTLDEELDIEDLLNTANYIYLEEH
jgi:hypothetical protein